MTHSALINPAPHAKSEFARQFCERFADDQHIGKYIFGYNRYTKALLKHYRVDAIVDDFYQDSVRDGLPVIPSSAIPQGSLVLAASGGNPLSARRRLQQLNVTQLDYFQFRLHSEEPLPAIHFNEGFEEDFTRHKSRYEWVYDKLADEVSRDIFRKLVNFRLQYDLGFLEGFTNRESEQYFEPFLQLRASGESFADIGAYDGKTTLTFKTHCPDYRSIQAFEPDPNNFETARTALRDLPRTQVHQVALSDAAGSLRLSPAGSGSQLSEQGTLPVPTARLDDITDEPFSFIKIDIEGAEGKALAGAQSVIEAYHPRLAVAVYHYTHGAGPFWQIPEQVLAIREDYDLYLRHYTESIYETVMFFVPKP